jgi:Zn-dependent protease with chaperone function
MAMDFFERQDLARTSSRRIILLFLLALPCVIAAVYCVSVSVYAVCWAFFAFWRSVFSEIQSSSAGTNFFVSFWQPRLLLWVGAATLLVVFGGALYKIKQLAPGGQVVALRLGGERLDPQTKKLDELRLLHVVEEMSVASGTPMPDIYVLRREFGLNAFVAGHTVSDMIVCVTEGCLRFLTRDELQGVVAHEYSHIFHGDLSLNMRLMGLVHGLLCITLLSYWLMSRTYRESDRDIVSEPETRTGVGVFADLFILVIGFLLAFIGWNGALFGRMIKGAVSRQREFLADAAAVQFTRYPEGLANALKKVKASPEKSLIHSPRAEEASHIFFCNGLEDDRPWLTSTHPPLEERVERIETMMGRSFVPQSKEAEEPVAELPGIETEASESQPEARLRSPKDEARQDDSTFVARLLAPKNRASETSGPVVASAKDAFADMGVPVARHLAYAAKLMEVLPESVRCAAREPRAATAVVYVLLLSPIEGVREAQLRLLKSRLPSEMCLNVSTLLSAVRNLNELVKIPVVELAFPALRRLSLAEYAAFMQNVGELIAADRQVDLFEFALRKMLHRHLEPKYRPVPKPEARHAAFNELATACSTLLSALAHAGQDSLAETQAAFVRGAKRLSQTGVNFEFVALADCTFQAVEAALDSLAQTRPPLKRLFLDACAQTVAADGRIRAREAELLRAIADGLDCPMPPFVR